MHKLDRNPRKLLLSIVRFRSRALVRRARGAQQRRDWTLAAKIWRDVVDVEPENAGAWIQLGNMLNELEQRDAAIAAFGRAGEIDPLLAHAPAGVAGVHERAERWQAAEESWNKAITILSELEAHGRSSQEELTHSLMHAALSATKNRADDRSNAYTARALELMPDILANPHYAAILMESAFAHDLDAQRHLLNMLKTMLPADVADKIDLPPKTMLAGLLEISPYLHHGRTNQKFVQMAELLYDRVGLRRQAMQLAEWQSELEPGERHHIERAFRAAVGGRYLTDARRLARQHARSTCELMLVHELAKLYDQVGAYDRARLLTRFVRRCWPHSRWHARQYILLTAMTRSLDLADNLTQIEIKAGRHDRELEQAYHRSAFLGGHYDEARRRIEDFLDQHEDPDADIMLGYALANAIGIEDADRHFTRAASRQMQSLGTTIGMAHMALRRRDFPLAMGRWLKVVAIHPEVTSVYVEIARCAYEMRDIDEAVRICEVYLARSPHDVSVGEFYIWLLTVNGRFADAQKAIGLTQARSGPSWDIARLAILCAAELGTLDRDWDTIAAMMPSAGDDEAGSRFYHAMRSLAAVERLDLLPKLLQHEPFGTSDVPWLWPYREQMEGGDIGGRGSEKRWRIAAGAIRSDISIRLDRTSDADVDALLAGSANFPAVHVINKFEQPRGGSELHALDLASQLRAYTQVSLWAPEMPHPEFTSTHRVRAIDPSTDNVPRGGVLVFVGIYFDIAKWIGFVRPARIIFLYNTFEAPSLFKRIDEAFRRTGVRPELLYCSTMMQNETGLPGRFEPSPIDLDLFFPPLGERPHDQPFRLGRHSRDVVEKHGSQDWKIYQAVANLGGESLVLGGTCMRKAYPAIPNMNLLSARTDGIPEFLRSLDAYFYHTSTWIEPWGRVVIEAMACGLPVVAHCTGGYAQAIRHEVDGLLFDTTDEAVRLVKRLAQEPLLRKRLGQEACLSVRNLFSAAEMKRLLAFYLLPDPHCIPF